MNALVAVAVPPAVVSVTFFAPAVPAGVTAVTVVPFTTVSAVAFTPPTWTFVAPESVVPVIVIVVPPAGGPCDGATDVIDGAAT